jgi:hypothetical protein
MHVPRFSRACLHNRNVPDCSELQITMTMPIATAPAKLQAEVKQRMRLSATRRKSGDDFASSHAAQRNKERTSQLTCEFCAELVQAKNRSYDSHS